ncbi:endospore germination permease [Paenibacillus doosanensis]|uniref:GerAB/ArcD/ProY family transporter n=1 Tax=Paenibacillus doosanensis TaxID=1229154 RepID=UPI00217FBA09|nr:endospore germination permease [Paenibacillus doosanensis]MCS7458971.1 endospore germination permease [Paenibacillus doosanensis]
MIEKGKISSLQMAVMLYPTVVITGILLLPSMLAVIAGRDMWISAIWSAAGGCFIVWICFWLHNRFPQQSIVEYSTAIAGWFPGKLIGLIIIFFYLQLNGYVVREYGEFLVGSFFSRTPLILIMGSVIFVSSFAVRGGVEVIGRSAMVFVPLIIVLFVTVVLLLTPELDLRRLLPVMEHGMKPSLLGALIPIGGWYGEYMIIAFLLPLLIDRSKGMRLCGMSIMAVMATLLITNLVVWSLYGGLSASVIYSPFLAARYIQAGDFIEHVEAIVMAIWILGIFIKISTFFYIIALGTAQWLGLSGYRVLVFPIGLLLLMFSVWSATNLQELGRTIGTRGPFYYATVQYLLPILLVIVAMIRKTKAGGTA